MHLVLTSFKVSAQDLLSIKSRYGNILSIRKEKHEKSKPAIVIPANLSFDTIVEDSLSVADRIVERTSIRGQWLQKYHSLMNLWKELIKKLVSSSLIKNDLSLKPSIMKEAKKI